MTTSPHPSTVATDLKRELRLFDAVMINAGTMIASAIFIVPATVAAAVHGTAVMTLVWVIGGVVSLLGGPSICEAAAGRPGAGGREAVPPAPARDARPGLVVPGGLPADRTASVATTAVR